MATTTVRKAPRRETFLAPARKNNSIQISVPRNQGPPIVRAVTIQKPASELYAFWRDVENLQRVIKDPVSITALSVNEGVTIKTGQTHMQRYLHPLLELVEKKKIDPSCIITHRVPLSQAPEAYAMFADRTDGCIKVVLDPSR